MQMTQPREGYFNYLDILIISLTEGRNFVSPPGGPCQYPLWLRIIVALVQLNIPTLSLVSSGPSK